MASSLPVLELTLSYDREDGVGLDPPKQAALRATYELGALLARAAAINASTPSEPSLSFSSLLIALITDPDGWLTTELTRQHVDLSTVFGRRLRSEEAARSATPSALPSPIGTTESARRVLENAVAIAQRLDAGSPVDVRHLCAAYPILPQWHDEDFREHRIDRLAWCREFGARMASEHPDEHAYWSDYADRASPVPLSSFSADVYSETDLLGIDRTVDALAFLIASTSTGTPLSLGVFGPWGSGKTFFMRHLRRRISQLAERQRRSVGRWMEKRQAGTATADDAPLYFGQVAQVEFNAWHYNESNLLASLVEHMFRNLRVLGDHEDDKDPELVTRRSIALAQLSGVVAEVTNANRVVADAEAKLERAKKEAARAAAEAEAARRDVASKAEELEASNTALAEERQAIEAAISGLTIDPNEVDTQAMVDVALTPVAAFIGEVRLAAETTKATVFDWKDFASRVFSTKGAIVIGLCVAAPLVARLAPWIEAKWAAFGGMVAASIAALDTAIGVLRKGRADFEAKMRDLEKAEQKRLADATQALEARRAAIVARARAEIAKLTRSLDERRSKLAAREAEVTSAARALAEGSRDLDEKLRKRAVSEATLQKVQQELEQLSTALLLEEFIKDRQGTDEYRKQLGFLARIRHDFQRLSELIANANAEWLRARAKGTPPLLNRIVLYIDDLDRCKESTVLAVLEAVHLLLAFPQFVCVVAVDPRWVGTCLRDRHRELFAADVPDAGERRPSDLTPVTVGDYLEKIFQIPIWMTPIESTTRAALVKALLGPTAAPVERRDETRRTRALPPSVTSTESLPPGDGFQVILERAKEAPDPLRITHAEAAFVDQIAGLLSDRPRALKRFVNVYRLLKASLPDIQRAEFVTDGPSSGHKICLSQLALFTSQPRLAPILVREIERAEDSILTLADWFARLPAGVRTQLQATFELLPDRAAVELEAFREWLPQTSRYLFHRVE